MNRVKWDDLVDFVKDNDLLKKKEAEKVKKTNKLLWVFAVIGAVVAVAGIAYAVYLYFTPDYLEDFEDDFDNDFDDDFYEDEEEAGEEKKEEAAK